MTYGIKKKDTCANNGTLCATQLVVLVSNSENMKKLV